MLYNVPPFGSNLQKTTLLQMNTANKMKWSLPHTPLAEFELPAKRDFLISQKLG